MAGNKINLTVVTPVKAFYEGRVYSVTLPSFDGEFGIMAGHTPMVFALKPGVAHIRTDEGMKHFVISEGYAEVSQNMALVVCDSAEWPEMLDINRMIDSYKEALANIKADNVNASVVSTVDSRNVGYVEDSERSLQRAVARMHLIELYGSDYQKERLLALKERMKN